MNIYHFNNQGIRPKQEDNLFISEDQKLFVVCDGVGGSASGGMASELVIKSISQQYQGIDKDPNNLIKYLILKANTELNKAYDNFDFTNSSTTITLVLIHENEAYLTHIGDSKIFYVNKSKKIWWVSRDHSLVQELFEAGILESEYEMKTHPLRSRITQAISNEYALSDENIRIHHIPDISSGDVFILCTDGVMEQLTSDEMISLFSESDKSVYNSFNYLKKMCEETSKDNNTAVVIEV